MFLLLVRSGFLDDLPNILNRQRSKPREIRPEQIERRIYNSEADERLDVFKDFLEGDSKDDMD
jgi:hypothetical protein